MMGRFIAVLKFLYYFESMDIEPEYLGVTTNEDGDIALSLFYENGVQFDMYLDEQDLSDLIMRLLFVAQTKRPWQKLHLTFQGMYYGSMPVCLKRVDSMLRVIARERTLWLILKRYGLSLLRVITIR